jgi:hypothetical protein
MILGSSKGNIYFIDLDQLVKNTPVVPVAAVFKTNPVSQALHITRRHHDSDILFVGGEMSDTILYLVVSIV